MPGRNSFIVNKCDVVFTWRVLFIIVSVNYINGTALTTAALLINIVTSPNFCLAFEAASVIDAWLETSHSMVWTLRLPAQSVRVYWSSGILTSESVNLQPSYESLMARSRPSPSAAPVKNTWSYSKLFFRGLRPYLFMMT